MALTPLKTVLRLLCLGHTAHFILPGPLHIVAASRVTVRTDKGPVRGSTHRVHHGYHKHRHVDIFYGIPYARPPVGDLRFMYPEPIDPWEGTLDATRKPNSCMQEPDKYFGEFRGSNVWNPNTNMSEDCLYLNVWTPHGSSSSSFGNKAVMVWIYGGSFMSGSSTLDVYDGKFLAAEEDVVVVSMQFRFGALGYLVLESLNSPGNAGMMDVRLALEWVQRNIHNFGGNAHNVTVFGESSGAVSAGLLMLSPLTQGFFHRVIMQSATPLAPWATTSLSEAIRRSKALAARLGCDPENKDWAVLDCLRKVPAWKFPREESKDIQGYAQFPFVPVVDGRFLTKSPEEYLAGGSFKKIPLLMGSNANEGTWLLVYNEPDHFKINTSSRISSETHHNVLDRLFHYHPQYPTKLGQVAKDGVTFQYTDWSRPYDQTMLRDQVEQAVGDVHFVCGVVDMAQTVASHGQDVYMYSFFHRMSNSPWPEWMGVLHGDEIFFVFGRPLVRHLGFKQEEDRLSRKMMKFWANFAKTGNPNNGSGEKNEEKWPKYTPEKLKFLNITLDILDGAKNSIGHGIKPRHCAFWRERLPVLASIESPPYNANCTRSSASKSGASSSMEPLTASVSLSSLVLLGASMSKRLIL